MKFLAPAALELQHSIPEVLRKTPTSDTCVTFTDGTNENESMGASRAGIKVKKMGAKMAQEAFLQGNAGHQLPVHKNGNARQKVARGGQGGEATGESSEGTLCAFTNRQDTVGGVHKATPIFDGEQCRWAGC